MSLYVEIGAITRALPSPDGLNVKLQTQEGAIQCEIHSSRPDLIEIATQARMTGAEIMLRRTEAGIVVALQPNIRDVAA